MKLPPAPPPSTEFKNAPGSTIPKEYAIPVRENSDLIISMAETSQEVKDLQKESLARQYVLIIDRSGSMGTADGPRPGTRWTSAQKAVENMIDTVFRYDIDHTIPLYLFDHEVTFLGEVTDSSQIKAVFKEFGPRGTTGLNGALREALETYAGSKRPNYEVVPGTTFIVLLDGGADNESDVIKTIQYYADPKNNYISNHTQIAISFIQIGDDSSATRFLNKLDNSIEPDIVDTKKDDVLYQQGGLDRILYDAIFD